MEVHLMTDMMSGVENAEDSNPQPVWTAWTSSSSRSC